MRLYERGSGPSTLPLNRPASDLLLSSDQEWLRDHFAAPGAVFSLSSRCPHIGIDGSGIPAANLPRPAAFDLR